MIINIIRQVLGRLIVALNVVFPPRKKSRTKAEQEKVNLETQKLVLYQFNLCPFCVRVRRMMTRLRLKIECRDIKASETHQSELIAGGGKRKVPCLRIEEGSKITWLYESMEINTYLTARFAA